jgi:Zn-finger nucleic acid-binding protein
MSTLTCPKCHGEMRNYERSGVHVDQCAECRGIFLDRGELERLIDAENSWADRVAAPAPAAPAAPAPPTQPGYAMPPAYDPRYDRDYDDHRGKKPYKKRKSFLEELFD